MKKYQIHIDERVCKGCSLCVFYCAKKCFSLSGKLNAKGYEVAEADPANCVGCKICQNSCPDLAIFVEEVEGE